ncbi:hypothetical protein O0235_06240 [Tepidiforma flava]|uniref:Amidophosphoribosyltransferase n=1 Tax=Tepidiforma flava TaxID=3004094 RepID=A0ABY7MCB5_9CHLR|nr:hypothetical protein [Tepidiforma flava]WBL37166.1 hypothetical protein O0235_06240 [Tepidiforma flava]
MLPESDNPREACGVFGVYSPGDDVARLTFYGLYALQHRGQESAGIAASNGEDFSLRTGMGLVAQVFDEEDLAYLKGHIAIGHTRYSTAGGSLACNAQPIVVHDRETGEPIALGHNGNLTNVDILREDLEAQGIRFESTADSEVIAHLFTIAPGRTMEERFHYVMRRLEGAYSVVMMTKDRLFAMRDPMGVRPLCLGRLDGGWVVASESCALEHLGVPMEREIQPGEVVVIDANGPVSFFRRRPRGSGRCARSNTPTSRGRRRPRGSGRCARSNTPTSRRPDSRIRRPARLPRAGGDGRRRWPGSTRWKRTSSSGCRIRATPAAIGYARASGIPYPRGGLVKNRYVGRTFIQPDQRIREAGVSLKFNALSDVLAGKRVVLVDGTASCAGRRRRGSSSCCGGRARRKCTCGSRRRRRSCRFPASSGWIWRRRRS